VQFTPSLPAWKQSAIDRMGFGLLDKLVLEYDKDFVPFWPLESDFITLRPDDVLDGDSAVAADLLPRESVFFVNYYALDGRPMLVALLHCGLGEWAETQSDEQMADCITRHLARYFPTAATTRPKRCTLTRWRQDPFAKGSYAYLARGSTAEDLDLLARPFGTGADDADSLVGKNRARIFWAGEHTEQIEFGFVQGALLSGRRAADEL
ncbi:amine oxidase, partial [Thamnocephalis sphaerospora]